MQLHDIKKHSNNKNRKRVGRGGKRGTYSGRGIKGQKARAGHKIPSKEKRLIHRFPKLPGVKFSSHKPDRAVINVGDLERILGNIDTITKQSFLKAGIIKKKNHPVKILGDGELKTSYTVKVPVSNSAKEKIEKADGKVISENTRDE